MSLVAAMARLSAVADLLPLPIGTPVVMRWAGQPHHGRIALHGVSTSGELRLLVWLSDGRKGVYRWFGLEAVMR